ncbi:hypothetical protein EW146_g7877 [Bondarzewia mesenterica]|uniref:C2H2-type domain-containing protein n=1 Tax=Bondarzewia mesenterica TaxID=1095465 RepID=A0A4S4LKG5_9AGAM|nr:hypothetical protein EW146_g7877 [Bondarzewia mesenterica]
MLASLLVLFASASMTMASHTITLTNKCGSAVPVWVDSAPGSVAYTGSQPGSVGAGSSVNVVVPSGWNSRICRNADGARCADGVTKESMTEFNMDSSSLDYYDISNIRGYTVAQSIHPHNTSPYGGCQTVSCSSANCPCDQAYPIGNEAGCGSTVDSPVKACPSGDFTITGTYPPSHPDYNPSTSVMSFDDVSLNYMQPTGVVLPPHHDEIMMWVEQYLLKRAKGDRVDCDLPQDDVDQSFATPLGGHYAPSHGPPYHAVTQEPASPAFYAAPSQAPTSDELVAVHSPPLYGNFDGPAVKPAMPFSDGYHPELSAGPSCPPNPAVALSAASPPVFHSPTQGALYGFPVPIHPPYIPPPAPISNPWATAPSAHTNVYGEEGMIRSRHGANLTQFDMGGSHILAPSSSSGLTAGSKRKSADADLEPGGQEFKMRRTETAIADCEVRSQFWPKTPEGAFAAGSSLQSEDPRPAVQSALLDNKHKSMVRHHGESTPASAAYPNALRMLREGPSVQPCAKTRSVRAQDPAAENEEREGEEDNSDGERKESEEGEDVSEEEEEENEEGKKESKVKRWVCPYPSCRRKDGSRVDFGTQPDLVRHLKYALAHQPERTFPCLHCPKAYTRSDPLLKHMKSKHPDELN